MKRLALAAATLISFASAASAATDYSAVFVFGDSLVDSGNAQIGSLMLGGPDPAPAATGHYFGRFSNGLNFADYLSLTYNGTPATPFALGGVNYGIGGAQAAPDPFLPSPPAPPRTSFDAQLGYFTADTGVIPGDALVIVTFGGNDLRAVRDGDPATTLDDALNALGQGLLYLQSKGAKNILVTGVPDVGAIPETLALGNPALAGATTAFSAALNAAIKATAQAVTQAGTDMDFFDLYAYEQAVRANPAAYGLTELTQSCQAAGATVVGGGGCAGYLYFDDKHPTTQVHAGIARAIAMQLAVPEPESWAMMIAGFAVVGAFARRKRGVRVAFA